MYLLDTNVLSELRKVGAGRADTKVMQWFKPVALNQCWISVITVMELELGILRVERHDVEQGKRLRAWMNQQVLTAFTGRTLDVTPAIALACARLHVPDPRSERDALIAATALIHGLEVVTRNTADFKATGVVLINPWQ
jgi:hypothetical protein